eukprot:7091660-Prymnesium_polylepis.1
MARTSAKRSYVLVTILGSLLRPVLSGTPCNASQHSAARGSWCTTETSGGSSRKKMGVDDAVGLRKRRAKLRTEKTAKFAWTACVVSSTSKNWRLASMKLLFPCSTCGAPCPDPSVRRLLILTEIGTFRG